MTNHQRCNWPEISRIPVGHPHGLRRRRLQVQRGARTIAISVTLLVTLTGCSTLRDITEIEDVKPWQRGLLARDDMQLTTDSLQQAVDDHIYFSKEASTGGSFVQGGGCGCN